MLRNGHTRRRSPPRAADEYLAIATDRDGTLNRYDWMGRRTLAALERWRRSGHKLILVTGETPDDLKEFPQLGLFDAAVAENGAVLYEPRSGRFRPLASPPPPELVRELRRRGIEPSSVGRVMVSVPKSKTNELREVIQGLGMPWRIIANRHQVMALPEGIDKATGLAAALETLGLTADQVVGVGDAENDLALLRGCGCGVAVASAVPQLRAQADLVTTGGAGRGVVDLIERLLGKRHRRRTNRRRRPSHSAVRH